MLPREYRFWQQPTRNDAVGYNGLLRRLTRFQETGELVAYLPVESGVTTMSWDG
jgi:hypothetical protein